MSKVKTYWKGIEEKEQSTSFIENSQKEFPQELPVQDFLADEKLGETSTNRRDFLKFMGFSVAAATLAACESPVIKSIPYVNKPEEITPGVANWYSSTYWDGNDYASILVKTREGRPIFVKGNKSYGINKGATTPRIVASVLSLYNSARLQDPTIGGKPSTWGKVDSQIKEGLKKTVAKGGKIRILTNTVLSPSTGNLINEFKTSLEGADVEVVAYDSISYSAITTANKNSFGKEVVPDYNFDKAKVIVSINADFLTNWMLSTDYIGGYLKNRNPKSDWMSKHFHFESTMSTTGASSDVRIPIKPSEEGVVAAAIYKQITGNNVSGVSVSPEMLERTKLAAENLKANKGESLLVAGTNCEGTQTIVNAINEALGNYGSTIDLTNHTHIAQGNDKKVETLVKEVEAGEIDALIMYNVNPCYTLPNGDKFAQGMKKIPTTVSFSQYADETASNCKFVCPDNHYLESWNDFSPKTTHYSIAQPAIRPLYNTAQAQESFLIWMEKAERGGKTSRVYYDYMRGLWDKFGFQTQSVFATFSDYWNDAVHNGSIDSSKAPVEAVSFAGNIALAGKSIAKRASKTGEFEVLFYQKNGIGDGNQAANPWLQELPDPITKVTWDNYITMSRADAEKGGYNVYIGQESPASLAEIEVNGKKMILPVFVLPGQKSGTLGIALGYGRGAGKDVTIGDAVYQTGEYGKHTILEDGSKQLLGENAFSLSTYENGEINYGGVATIFNLNKTYPLACTQLHHTFMGRTSIVRETTFGVYKHGNKNDFNKPHTLKDHVKGKTVEKHISEFDLWDPHPVENVGHRWGMTIDLNSCIGCGSCIIACHAENNVPVVGKDEIRRGRDMHWLRLDRYFSSAHQEVREAALDPKNKEVTDYSYAKLEIAEENPTVVQIPMMCQHCNHAPCETVCPVAATTHSNEGLNQMTYNRCIGTRYCANNCPYKVRRFNWFNYPSNTRFQSFNPSQFDMGRMVLNPDVTVRTRGVMEKCSMCVQQIQAGKFEAKNEGRPIIDGDVQSACSSSCPTSAITFGDLNDTKSKVQEIAKGDRSYHILEEIGTKPNIFYQVKVRNT